MKSSYLPPGEAARSRRRGYPTRSVQLDAPLEAEFRRLKKAKKVRFSHLVQLGLYKLLFDGSEEFKEVVEALETLTNHG